MNDGGGGGEWRERGRSEMLNEMEDEFVDVDVYVGWDGKR